LSPITLLADQVETAPPVLWQAALVDTGMQLLLLVAPLILFTILLHVCERIVQGNLIRRFGWGGVLWTAWLGTPIHELSHAAMAVLWGRKIDKLVLFEPDPKEGRLGYVRYSYRPNSKIDQIGNFFISTAPLLGGGLVLYGLLWVLFPSAAREAFASETVASALVNDGGGSAVQEFGQLALRVGREIVTLDSLKSWRLYLFVYLVLAVGCHMAPSPVDYRGATTGGWLVAGFIVGGLLLFNFIHHWAGGEPGWLLTKAIPIVVPLLVVLGLGVILCMTVSLLVVGLVQFAPLRRGR